MSFYPRRTSASVGSATNHQGTCAEVRTVFHARNTTNTGQSASFVFVVCFMRVRAPAPSDDGREMRWRHGGSQVKTTNVRGEFPECMYAPPSSSSPSPRKSFASLSCFAVVSCGILALCLKYFILVRASGLRTLLKPTDQFVNRRVFLVPDYQQENIPTCDTHFKPGVRKALVHLQSRGPWIRPVENSQTSEMIPVDEFIYSC